jgi:thiamine kinase-like enzyme
MFLDTFQTAHAIRPGSVDSKLTDSWWHWFDISEYLTEIEAFFSQYGPWLATTKPDGENLRDRLARLINTCRKFTLASDVSPARDEVTLGLCRVDANLANTVQGPDGRLRWVDWEYSGWGDIALDLADMRWHAALEGLSEMDHRWIRTHYRRPNDDPAFDQRLTVWDRIIVTRWPFLILRWLWSLHNGPDRLRLTPYTADPDEVRARMVRLIARAEEFRG